MSLKAKKSREGVRLEILKGWSLQVQLGSPNVVRIFLSSTFHDFIHERNYLFKEVLPNLERWCQERGLEFQVSDMRWGIRDNADSDHDGMSMCLHEVQHCQQLSIGPNFVVCKFRFLHNCVVVLFSLQAFIGNRYGKRPIPSSILASEFSVICEHIADQQDRDLLTSFYQMDSNNVPPVFLRKRKQDLSKNHDSTKNDLQETEQERLIETETKLRTIFLHAAKKAVLAGKLEFAYRFVASVTEQEIWTGILNCDAPEKHAICFMRNITNLKIDPANKTISRYADLKSESGDLDETLQEMLGELKNVLIPAKLPETSIMQYSLEFDSSMGINPACPSHEKYLQELGNTFQLKITDLIINGLKSMEQVSVQDPVYEEVVQHANFAVNKAQLYCGHETVLNKLFKRFSDKTNNQPMILYGESGVGKTATVAKLIQETWKNIEGPPNVVYRFLGITPSSSSLDSLFLSLSMQISELYGLRPPSNNEDDFNLLRPYFFELLEQVGKMGAAKQQLIIILDSLDQLSPAYGAHLMNWLPDRLPARVKLLLTVMPHYENILTRLQARLKPSNFVELTQLTNETATDILSKLLEQSSRTLQPHQMKLVEDVFKDALTPLLLHMTVIEARQWKSFIPEDQLKLGSTIREAIHILFERLERNHGKVLVSHALAYLVAAKNGLTEKEMEEILSLDNEVLDDVYQYWAPPSDSEIRIPPLVFVRLKQDMSDFIMNRNGDNMTVMGLYHKQFTEVILQRYLSSAEARQKIHGTLADFFLGEWYGKKKPVKMKLFQEDRLLLRRVPPQPLRFGGEKNHGRFNLRKLNELPYHLVRSKDYLRARTEVFGNFKFLHAKIEACGFPAVLRDFDLYLRELEDPDTEISYIKQCIRMVKATLEYKSNENLLAAEFLGRMTNLAHENFPIMKTLLDQAHQWCMERYPEQTLLIPQNQCFMAPTGILVTNLIGHNDTLIDLACSQDRKTMVTAGKDKTIRIWDLDTDTVIHIIELHELPEKLVICDVQDRVLVLDYMGGLSIFDLKAGNLLYRLEPKELQNSKNLEELSISGNNKNVLKESFSRGSNSTFCFLFDRIFVGAKDRDIFLLDVSEEPMVLKRIQTDLNINCARKQENLLLISLGANCEVCLNPRLLSCSIVTYKKVSQILGSAFVGPEQHCLVSVVNIDKKASLIIDIISNKNDTTKKDPVTVSPKSPAILCDFLKTKVAIATPDQVYVLEVPDKVEVAKNGGKFKTVFSTAIPLQKYDRKNSMIGSVMNADLQHLVCLLRLINTGSSTVLVVGSNDETIRLYDIKSQRMKGLLSGLWGQPTIVASVGPYLFTGSHTTTNVKVWDLSVNTENNTQVLIESFSIPPTCWAEKGEFTLCSATAEKTHICISTSQGVQKYLKVSSHSEIVGLLCLVSSNTLLFSDKTGKVHESVLKLTQSSRKLHSKVVAKLGAKVLKWSYCKTQKILAFLLEDQRKVKMDISNYSTSEIASTDPTNNKQKALDLCLTKHGLVLFCKDGGAFLQTFSGKTVVSFDWPAQNCHHFCTKTDFFAAFIQSRQTQEQWIEVWNLSNGSRSCTIDVRNLPVTCMELTNDAQLLLVGMGSTPQGTSQRQIRIYRTNDGSTERKSIYLYSVIAAIYCFDDNYHVGVALEIGYFGFFKLKIGERPKKKSIPNSSTDESFRSPKMGMIRRSTISSAGSAQKSSLRKHSHRSTACSLL